MYNLTVLNGISCGNSRWKFSIMLHANINYWGNLLVAWCGVLFVDIECWRSDSNCGWWQKSTRIRPLVIVVLLSNIVYFNFCVCLHIHKNKGLRRPSRGQILVHIQIWRARLVMIDCWRRLSALLPSSPGKWYRFLCRLYTGICKLRHIKVNTLKMITIYTTVTITTNSNCRYPNLVQLWTWQWRHCNFWRYS